MGHEGQFPPPRLSGRCGFQKQSLLPMIRAMLTFGSGSKRRFSEFPSEPACNQEYAGGLEQGLDDEAEPVVAQREAPVFEHPSIAALHRPAPRAEP